MNTFRFAIRALSVFAVTVLTAFPADAEIRIDNIIVDFNDGKTRRNDIEVTNDGKALLYVSVKPVEIVRPGLEGEKRRTYRDPMKMGMLVSPTRMVLEPGQTKPVRLSILERPQDRDRIYRVRIEPAVGRTVGTKTGLRILVGYDVLVMVRPAKAKAEITGGRKGRKLTLRNTGNTNVKLMRGKQCDKAGKCVELPAKRLHAGATWTVELPLDAPAKYRLKSNDGVHLRTF